MKAKIVSINFQLQLIGVFLFGPRKQSCWCIHCLDDIIVIGANDYNFSKRNPIKAEML